MTTIISLGGSLIVPDEIDVGFLKKFKKAMLEITRKEKVVIICGGGKTARKYQKAGAELHVNEEDMDWLGIKATFINAQLVKAMMGTLADKKVYTKPEKPKSKITIAAGWLPGWSTDYDAVMWAKKTGAKKVINMSNVNYLYDNDPKKFQDAKKVKEMNWADYRKMAGNVWTPGLNLPFDPIASRMAEKLKLSVYIIGKDVKNLMNLTTGKDFKGSVIR